MDEKTMNRRAFFQAIAGAAAVPVAAVVSPAFATPEDTMRRIGSRLVAPDHLRAFEEAIRQCCMAARGHVLPRVTDRILRSEGMPALPPLKHAINTMSHGFPKLSGASANVIDRKV